MSSDIASASQRHFHEDADLFVEINRETGEYTTHRNWVVFDENDDQFHHETHISKEDSKLEIGETYTKAHRKPARNTLSTRHFGAGAGSCCSEPSELTEPLTYEGPPGLPEPNDKADSRESSKRIHE